MLVEALWIISKAAEAEDVALDIEIRSLQLLFVVVGWAAAAAEAAKQEKLAQTGIVLYSIIIFQALALTVMQKSISLNMGKDF